MWRFGFVLLVVGLALLWGTRSWVTPSPPGFSRGALEGDDTVAVDALTVSSELSIPSERLSVLPEEPVAETGSLLVVAVDPSGAHLEGLEVQVWPMPLAGWGPPPWQGTTGSDGEVTFPALEPGSFAVGRSGSIYHHVEVQAGETYRLVLELESLEDVVVEVLDPLGNPREGASISFSSYGERMHKRVVCCTDGTGRIVLPAFQYGSAVTAIHPDHTPSLTEVLSRGVREVRLRLGPGRGGTLQVAVTLADGTLPEHGVVAVGALPLGIGHRRSSWLSAEGVTAFEGLAAGEYVVEAYSPDASFASSRMEVTAGVVTEVTLELPEGRSVRGRVMDEAGNPLPGLVAVTVDGVLVRTERRAVTSSTGDYELRGLSGSEQLVRVESPEWGSGSLRIAPGEDDVHGADVVLATGDVLRGTLLDPSHRPLVGWMVGIPSTTTPELWRVEGITDSEGQFSLPGAREIEPVPLEVRGPGPDWGRVLHTVSINGATGDVTVLVPQQAIPSTRLELLLQPPPGLEPFHGIVEVLREEEPGAGLQKEFRGTTVTVGPLAPGEVWLRIRSDRIVTRDIGPIVLAGPGTVWEGPVSLELAGSILCRVEHESSEPWYVDLVRVGQNSQRAPVRSGQVRFTGLPAGEHRIRFVRGSSVVAEREVGVVAGSEAVEVY